MMRRTVSPRFTVTRLEDRITPVAPGDLDTVFTANAEAAFAQAGLTNIADVEVLPGGAVLALGTVFTRIDSTTTNVDFGIVRLKATGVIDPAFGTNGLARIAFDQAGTNFNDSPQRIGVSTNGSIVAVGIAETVIPGFSTSAGYDAAVAVLRSDGTLNTDFDTDGKATYRFVANTTTREIDLHVRPNGSFALSTAYNDAQNTNTTFGVTIVPVRFGSGPADGPEYTVGKALVLENARPANSGFQTRSLPAFAPDGGALSVITTRNFDSTPQPIGTPFRDSFQLTRYRVSESTNTYVVDPNFGTNGTKTIAETKGMTNGRFTNTANYGLIFGDDGWPTLGQTTGDFSFGLGYTNTTAYTPGGELDGDYGNKGVSTTVPFNNSGLNDRLADGRQFTLTQTYTNGGGGALPANQLVRITKTGTVDNTFATAMLPADMVPSRLVADTTGVFIAGTRGSTIAGDPGSGPRTTLVRYLGDDPTAKSIAVLPSATAATGTDGTVRVFGNRSAEVGRISPNLPNPERVRTLTTDLDGDGAMETILGTGPGSPARILVDGLSRFQGFAPIPTLDVFEGFTGGVYLAAADLDGDARPELVVTPDEGGG
ncbi:MAG: hypothetical protein ACRCZF_13390, partial [Gemmataceae bacterium]